MTEQQLLWESLIEERKRYNCRKLARYKPYPKQVEFHAAGAIHRERLLMACNKLGKTYCGAAEMAIHLTGQYPEGWPGRRFDKAVRAWALGVTTTTTRDVVQMELIGPPERKDDWGTGMIPGDCLGKPSLSDAVRNSIDTIPVLHVSGAWSRLQFKSYELGRERLQGPNLELVWADEECSIDVYFELLSRTNSTGGMVYMTFTPEKGWSEVVQRFLGAGDSNNE